MKVAILTDAFPPYISGVTTHCLELARWLIASGHEVLFIVSKSKKKRGPLPGLERAKIIELPSCPTPYPGFRMSLPLLGRVLSELKRFKADIIDSQTPTFLGVDGIIASKFLKIPCVGTFHTLITSREYLQMLFRMRHVGLFEHTSWAYHRWFYNSGDRVLVATEGMRTLLTEHGVKKEKIDLIPILFDSDRVRVLDAAEKEVLKQKYGLEKSVAVFVGRLSAEKGLDFLLKAWKEVVKKIGDTTLLVVGDGKEMANLKKIAQAYGIEKKVVFTGAIPHATLMSSGLLSVADVFVSASITETFGLSGLETMAHGVPVMLPRTQGLCEMAGEGGALYEPGDLASFIETIVPFFKNSELKKERAHAAQKCALQFGGSVGIKKIIACYERAIAEHALLG